MRYKKAASKRKVIAFTLALLLHLAVFGAAVYPEKIAELVPDFIKELFLDSKPSAPVASLF